MRTFQHEGPVLLQEHEKTSKSDACTVERPICIWAGLSFNLMQMVLTLIENGSEMVAEFNTLSCIRRELGTNADSFPIRVIRIELDGIQAVSWSVM